MLRDPSFGSRLSQVQFRCPREPSCPRYTEGRAYRKCFPPFCREWLCRSRIPEILKRPPRPGLNFSTHLATTGIRTEIFSSEYVGLYSYLYLRVTFGSLGFHVSDRTVGKSDTLAARTSDRPESLQRSCAAASCGHLYLRNAGGWWRLGQVYQV